MKKYFLIINTGKHKPLTISDFDKEMLLKSAPIVLESMIKYQKDNFNLLEKDADKTRKSLKLELDKLRKTK